MTEHLKEILWAFFLILFWLACIFLIFQKEMGLAAVFWVCLGLAAIVAVLFSLLLLLELVVIGLEKLFNKNVDKP